MQRDSFPITHAVTDAIDAHAHGPGLVVAFLVGEGGGAGSEKAKQLGSKLMHSRNCTLYAMLADILGQSARASHDKQLSRMDNGTSILSAAPTNCICRMLAWLCFQPRSITKTSAGDLNWRCCWTAGGQVQARDECHRCCDSMLEARGGLTG